MKHIASLKIGLILLLCTGLSLSCGGKVTTRTEEPEYEFTINGALVKDMDLGKDIACFTILRDSDPVTGAVVIVGSDTLADQGGGKYFKDASKLFDFGEHVLILISSSVDTFALTTSGQVPGSFQITSINPSPVTGARAEEVFVYGSSSAGAQGYFMNVIRPDGSNGYAGLVSLIDMIQGKRLPRDTFGEGGAFLTGTYKVYAVAYHGSFVSYPGMPFYLPDDLPTGNISGANGTIGAGVVARLKYLSAE